MKQCAYCKREIEDAVNYCSWQCHIDEARALGGKVIAPNGLPATVIKFDGSMLEHEHADHPSYVFPVEIEYRGVVPEGLDEWDCSYKPETHALIYTDGNIAITLYEHTYGAFFIADGSSWSNKNWHKDWFLTKESIDKIVKAYSNQVR